MLVFEIDKNLEKNFLRQTKGIDSEIFEFSFPDKLPEPKAFKIIAGLVEDSWSVKKVQKEKNIIRLFVNKREKQKMFFPETDHHFNRDKDRYQFHTLLSALPFVKETKQAIDIGGHIGLYSSALLDSFDRVDSFEPSPKNIACFKKNVPEAKIHTIALGDKEEVLKLNIAPDNTGNNSIVESFGKATVLIEVKTLDQFEFEDVNLIKIDVQGYEEQVLKGSGETIKKNKPIMIVELITHKDSPPNKAAMKILESYGYETVFIMGKDYILKHKGM